MSNENANSAAFPSTAIHDVYAGLTKREYFAAICLQGMLANPELYKIASKKLSPDDIAAFYVESSIEQADELLIQLSQSK